MITIENAGPVHVGTAGGELWLTNAGSWSLGSALYVRVGTVTNTLQSYADGARVLVDGSGGCQVVNGPDLVGAGVFGFAVGLTSVGIVIALRAVWRGFSRIAVGSVGLD